MKSGSAKAMTKGELLKSIATEHGLKTKDCSNILNSLVTVAAKEVKKTGVFTIPGLCRIKTRTKPATKACTKMIFGKETKVKAKPAKTVVKAFQLLHSRSRSKEAWHDLYSTFSEAVLLWESHSRGSNVQRLRATGA